MYNGGEEKEMRSKYASVVLKSYLPRFGDPTQGDGVP